jgi:ferric-dicitrate binding protein FerR (iron transport regulator)
MDRISYLVGRYLQNRCTREELDEFLEFVKKNPNDEALRDSLWNAWQSEDTRAGESDVAVPTRDLVQHAPAETAASAGNIMWRVAAAVLVLALGVLGFFVRPEDVPVSSTEVASPPRNIVATSGDERRLIVLPDRSRIWVNSNSRITYDSSFNEKTREVMLYGEAYFDIESDPTRPFIIRTGKVTTTVLGTAFNIRAFPEEKTVTVTVARGIVRVEDENKKSELITANEELKVDVRTTGIQEHKVDARKVTTWIKGDLVLHEIAFGDVKDILEERYAVDIRFDNELLERCRFTSTFFQNASLDDVMTAICLVNGASYSKNGNVVTIHGNGCEQTP